MTLPGDTLQPLTIHYMIFPHIIIHCSPLLHIYCTNASHIFHRRFTDNSHMLHIHFTYTFPILHTHCTCTANICPTFPHKTSPFIAAHCITSHWHHLDITWLHTHGKKQGRAGKKRHNCAHSCCQRSLTPIQAHSLPSACRAESCLLCCQPEPSLNHYLPNCYKLLHDSLADCKLKGDELSP